MGAAPVKEIRLISCDLIGHVSDIKLIRTDTTLDLSQKAEKGMLCTALSLPSYSPLQTILVHVGFYYLHSLSLSLSSLVFTRTQ